MQWRSCFYYRGSNPNFHRGHPQHGRRKIYLWVWCWIVIVSVCCAVPSPDKRGVIPASRTIVPIYQSEISPPNHVGCHLLDDSPWLTRVYSEERSRAWNSLGIFLDMHLLWYVYSMASCSYHSQWALQWIDYFSSFIESDWSWRIPLLIQCIIGAILAAGSLVMPESPR